MQNDVLKVSVENIQVIAGKVIFPEYEHLKNQALALADQIGQVEITDENIQASKKMLAAVNKRLKEMEDRRITIKKEMLEPYSIFESQVKEIVNIVRESENIVRDQLRELEEKERDQKRAAIQEIFEKRIKHYNFIGMFGFEDFIKPQHLNKSVTIKSVETDMVEWLEKKDVDLKVINGLPDREEILTEYFDTKDLAIAIQIVNQRNETKRQIKKVMNDEPKKDASFVFTITNEKDATALEMFMQLKNIKYTVEKVEK